MKKFIVYLFFAFLVTGCQNAREGFTLKKENSDEFLVEKKNPLVMPPDYDQLPIPKDFQLEPDKSEEKVEIVFENIIKKSEKKSSEIITNKTNIENSVLEKIN